uniref:Uncharacterized protein n=1 Tax=Hyaloperonospora arabidopsidis (strain Emoy2) TaxID=559515 RepID=M4B7K2_HYAAE
MTLTILGTPATTSAIRSRVRMRFHMSTRSKFGSVKSRHEAAKKASVGTWRRGPYFPPPSVAWLPGSLHQERSHDRAPERSTIGTCQS